MKLYHGTLENNGTEINISCIEFKNKLSLIDYIDEYYCGKNKEVVFVVMIGDKNHDYFVTDSYLKVQKFIEHLAIGSEYFVFEEPSYTEAFEYCIDASESHKLN